MSPQMRSLHDIRKLAGAELSMTSRLGYVVLLLVAAAMTTVVLLLWITEPGLPGRARWAFAAMSFIGICWIGLATWALTTHRPLAARDRVIAGWMAVIFTSVFVFGAGLAAVVSQRLAALGAVATGLVMLAAAIQALRKARRRFVELRSRREELVATA